MLQIQLIGNLGTDSKIQEINGNKIINFSVAINDNYKDSDGNVIERTTWVNCAIAKKEGSTKVAEYLLKGTKVFVQGKSSVKVWKDNNGVHQPSINVWVDRVELLSTSVKKEENNNSANAETSKNNDFSELPVGLQESPDFN